MILTGNQIKWAREHDYLSISDWDEKRLNPNSYNLRLADELMVYENPSVIAALMGHKPSEYDADQETMRPITLDMKKEMATTSFWMPKEGVTLLPGILYLGRTMEYTETHKFVPMLEGRSSVGRLGISIHSTAGFGDIGFCGYWTLEISCVQPVRIYPGVEICQIYYHTIAPDCDIWIPDDDTIRSCETCRHDRYVPNHNEWPCTDCWEDTGREHWEATVMKYEDGGKYQKNTGIQPSMMWKEFEK